MVYNLLRKLIGFVMRLLFRWEYSGLYNVPASGPTLIVSNHISFWDPLVVGCALERRIHFMAKEELFQIPLFGWAITKLHAFPVRRETADRTAIRTAVALLASGEMVGVFPEGTRSKTGKLGKAEPGVALIAAKTGAVIIPVAVKGTNKIFRQGNLLPKFEVIFGNPIPVKRLTGKEYLETVTRSVMTDIAGLLGEEYYHGR